MNYCHTISNEWVRDARSHISVVIVNPPSRSTPHPIPPSKSPLSQQAKQFHPIKSKLLPDEWRSLAIPKRRSDLRIKYSIAPNSSAILFREQWHRKYIRFEPACMSNRHSFSRRKLWNGAYFLSARRTAVGEIKVWCFPPHRWRRYLLERLFEFL